MIASPSPARPSRCRDAHATAHCRQHSGEQRSAEKRSVGQGNAAIRSMIEAAPLLGESDSAKARSSTRNSGAAYRHDADPHFGARE
jgi:hypothetical protein